MELAAGNKYAIGADSFRDSVERCNADRGNARTFDLF
jgi:hypothetical protein